MNSRIRILALALLLFIILIGSAQATDTWYNFTGAPPYTGNVRNDDQTNWVSLVEDTAGTYVGGGTGDARYIIVTPGSAYKYLGRGYFVFNTASLPDDQFVKEVWVKCYVSHYHENAVPADDIVMVNFDPANPASVVVDDFDLWGYDILGWLNITSASTWYTREIDPELADVSLTGNTVLGYRWYNDLAKIAPTAGSENHVQISDAAGYEWELYVLMTDEAPPELSLNVTMSPETPNQYTKVYFTQTATDEAYHFGEVLQGGIQVLDFGYWNDTYRESIVFDEYFDPGMYSYHGYAIDALSNEAEVWLNFTVIPGTPPVPTTFIPTVTYTATPTPWPDTCGYWTFSVNTTQIYRDQAVLGTLEESAATFHRVDWVKVLPSGSEILEKQFIDDPGIFGLGSGWVQVNPVTGAASASSEAAAKEQAMTFNTIGQNKIKTRVYEDKSLIRTLYNSYELQCEMSQDINVGSSYGEKSLCVQVWESDTGAVIYDVPICIYDYSTGLWQNKTAGIGQTYFYLTEGHRIRIYVDTDWDLYDEDLTLSAASFDQCYRINLNRPNEEIVNESWVIFSVKASNLMPLQGAGIQIRQTGLNDTFLYTNLGGTAQISIDEGSTISYTVSKYGYYSAAGSQAVGADDVYKTIILMKDPTIPLDTWPATPLPTITPFVTDPGGAFGPDGGFGGGGTGGSGTPTPTQGTGGSGGFWIPGGGSGGTGAATPLPTLDTTVQRDRESQALNIWYENLPGLTAFFILMIIVGGLSMMMEGMNRAGGGRRRR